MKKSLCVIAGLVTLSGCVSTMDETDTNVSSNMEESVFEMNIDVVKGKTFMVTHLNEVTLPDDVIATMKFSGKEDRITGNGFCNLYSGEYDINYSGNLEIDDVVTTRRLCGDDLMEHENMFNKMLSHEMVFEPQQLGYKVTTEVGSFHIFEYQAVVHEK